MNAFLNAFGISLRGLFGEKLLNSIRTQSNKSVGSSQELNAKKSSLSAGVKDILSYCPRGHWLI